MSRLAAVMGAGDSRAKVRGLFEERDAARAAAAEAKERLDRLRGKLAELQGSLPKIRQAIKDREYDWRMAQAKLDVSEATADDVAAAEKAIDEASGVLEEAEGKINATENLIVQGMLRDRTLDLAVETTARKPWAALAEQMKPDVQKAVAIIKRFYIAELNAAIFGISADVFLRRVIDLGDAATIAAALEAEFRK